MRASFTQPPAGRCCGTAYVSAWLARRGARPAGLDNSAAQLATAGQGATTRYPFVTLEWARQWPCEEVRKARKGS